MNILFGNGLESFLSREWSFVCTKENENEEEACSLIIDGSLMSAELGGLPKMQPVKAGLLQGEANMQDASLPVQEAAEVTELEDLPSEEQQVTAQAVSEAEESGKAAGQTLNELDLKVYGPEKILIYRSDNKSGKYLKIETLS